MHVWWKGWHYIIYDRKWTLFWLSTNWLIFRHFLPLCWSRPLPLFISFLVIPGSTLRFLFLLLLLFLLLSLLVEDLLWLAVADEKGDREEDHDEGYPGDCIAEPKAPDALSPWRDVEYRTTLVFECDLAKDNSFKVLCNCIGSVSIKLHTEEVLCLVLPGLTLSFTA